MRTVSVSNSLAEGFMLRVEEAPAPIILIENHWPAWPMNLPLVHVPFYWLTNKLFRWTDNHRKTIIKFPITREQADIMDPDAWWWLDDED